MLLFSILYGSLILNLSLRVNGYGSGAPELACESMTPGHGVRGKGPGGPYKVEASVSDKHGKVSVTLSGDKNSTSYKGILLQARKSEDKFALGAWEIPADGNFRSLLCNGLTTSALTHSNSNRKSLPMVFMWNAPNLNYSMNYTIYATVLEQYQSFYIMIPSNTFAVNPYNTASSHLMYVGLEKLNTWILVIFAVIYNVEILH